ncbi:HAD family hydrolase [Brevibacillus nitrificans]|uniref:HAD family hydrolase n=1 Tax=Brevibacillus nitrificans TaxID=651560 RepID=UPI002866DF1A|nr:HAD family hydrolase [Brevibacillus nitrificans]MDR7318026.1 hydroxymethylpyrimidine pyrophosphatase-like HAD family hydrolase [Brevibacillus nitrificans]
MVLFASDLDQTLIYSSRHTGDADLTKLRVVEVLDGKDISFMTEDAINSLQDLMNRVMFIPVTTRTINQYNRVTIFSEVLQPTYAVTSNGGNILIHGKVDEAWSQHIRRSISTGSMAMDQVIGEFEKLTHESWFHRGIVADELFYYGIVERDLMPIDEIYSFGDWLTSNGWELSIQGRKIYFIPKAVNKRDAVLHIKENEGMQTVVASGDSLLDLPLIHASSHALIPAHGEVFTLGKNDGVPFTHRNGIKASEEILEFVGSIQN